MLRAFAIMATAAAARAAWVLILRPSWNVIRRRKSIRNRRDDDNRHKPRSASGLQLSVWGRIATTAWECPVDRFIYAAMMKLAGGATLQALRHIVYLQVMAGD